MLFIFFAFPATGYILLQHKGIQNRLTDYIMTIVSKNLKTDFIVGEVDLAFPYRLRLKNIYLEDLHHDTLLFARSLTLGVRSINPMKKVIKVNAVNLNEAYLRLTVDSTNLINIQFIIEHLKGGDGPSKQGWTTALNNIRLKKSRFRLRLYPYKETDHGINFTDIRLYNLNATLHHFHPGKDSTTFSVKSLSCIEASGFQLNDLNLDFRLSKQYLKFLNLSAKTPFSTLKGDGVQLLFDSWQDFKDGGVFENVNLVTSLKNAYLNLGDLGFFAPGLYNTSQVILFSGQSKGTIENLKIKDVRINFGNASVIRGDFSINGLPDTREAFIFADFKEFRTSGEDIASLHLPGNKKVLLPERLNKLGSISYKGKFTGFIDDFVTFGSFTTKLGVLSSDLLFKPDTANYFSFSGQIITHDFDLGSFLDIRETIGHINTSVSVTGFSSGNDLSAKIKGEVLSFDMKGYQYKNIKLSGNLLNKTFDGSLFINDPNINLDFHGKVDFSDKLASYDFSANVTQANLYALNIDRSDPEFNVSFYIIANANGNNFSNLNGEIRLLNSLFEKRDKQLQVYDFYVQSDIQPENNYLRLRSDFVDAELSGIYDLTKAGLFLKKIMHDYLPALIDSNRINTYSYKNSFRLSVLFKNTKPIFDFFLPEYYIDETTTLNAEFDSEKLKFGLHCQSPRVRIKDLVWNDYYIDIIGNTGRLEFESGGLSLVFNDQIMLDNFTVISNAYNDSVNLLARWNNWEEPVYRGSINANLLFSKPSGYSHPRIAVNLLPTTVVTYDTIWMINQCEILIDSNNLIVNDFSINHHEELFTLNGRLSSKPEDKIDLSFINFNLGNLNNVTNAKGLQIEGILNGEASFSSLLKNPMIISNLNIDSLIINKEKLGTANIISTWDNAKKALEIQAYALRHKLKTVLIDGNYYLLNNGLDFNVKLDKLRLDPFNPFLAKLVENLRGMASGEVSIDGTIDKPVVNGEINLQKAAFTIKYLQSRYNFSERIKIINNNIYFRDMRVFDGYGNKAFINGSLRNSYFRDLQFDIAIQAEDLLFLNTKSTDNKLFYGTAFATGLVNISGSPSNVDLKISAKTEKNTVFNIPLSEEGELTEYNFITLFHEDTIADDESGINEYRVDLSGIRMNFDLEVTPDAEVQIIFDPKVGDILRASGTGNLNMKISTSGNFIMFGDFTIDKGDYLFTLGNIINKKFVIDPGGWIRWTGDPVDASIDLTAKYRARTSLGSLGGDFDPEVNPAFQGKTNVDCMIAMTGKLMKPSIRYDIDLPQSEEDIKMRVKNAINSSDELNRQFISLVVMNSFVPGQSSTGTESASNYSNVAGVNASELLSNQLSHWLSQISNDFDIGVNYRPDRVRGEEVEVMLSTQLFNDRLSINGSVDVATTNADVSASNNIVGEFDIDYKLGKSGRFRLKTYNHINNDLLKENSPYTQGLGFFYKEEFNTVKELWQRYWRNIAGKKEEKDTGIDSEENIGQDSQLLY
ncbi:MAG: translocation/assembly module TamB [Bacteroidales bacterium]|nr:translocation/assembly module TamB [Bacteroidales bacterium]MBN2762641.1 translocation/assembly module TamB [Bacteroidales bacterium]